MATLAIIEPSAALSASGTPAAGSSRSRKRGSAAKARAISTFRRMPNDSSLAVRSANSLTFTSSNVARARALLCRPDICLWARIAPTSTFSKAVSRPNRRVCWKVLPTPNRAIRCGDQPDTLCPLTVSRPVVGVTKPESMLTSVVLPDPFGPIRPRRFPGVRVRSTPSSAATPAKCFETATAFIALSPPCGLDAFLLRNPIRIGLLSSDLRSIRQRENDRTARIVRTSAVQSRASTAHGDADSRERRPGSLFWPQSSRPSEAAILTCYCPYCNCLRDRSQPGVTQR
jgi:hypothetical protein